MPIVVDLPGEPMPVEVATPADLVTLRGELEAEITEVDEEATAHLSQLGQRVDTLALRVETLTDQPSDPDLTALDVTVADLERRVTALEAEQATPPAPQTGSITVGLPYTVISSPTDAAVQAGIKAWLATKGTGNFARTRLAFAFIGEASLTTPLLPSTTGQIQGPRWVGMCKRGTVLKWSSDVEPVLTSYGQLRNWVMEDLTFKSGTPNAKGLYFRSDNGKTNQDGEFDTCEWMGSWDYGIAFDGQDNTANLNSEIIFNKPALSNDASFKRGWLVSGLDTLFQQENQFLNFVIRDSKLEGSHGDYLVFNKGGSIQVEGFNSWIHTGQAALDKIPRGRMIYLPVGGNGDSVMFLNLEGCRPELRSQQSIFIDSSWSSAGAITINTLRSAANAFKIPDFESMIFRGDARVMMFNSHLAGHIGLRASAKPRMLLDNVQSAGNQAVAWSAITNGVDSTTNPSKGIVRVHESASAANVKIR